MYESKLISNKLKPNINITNYHFWYLLTREHDRYAVQKKSFLHPPAVLFLTHFRQAVQESIVTSFDKASSSPL